MLNFNGRWRFTPPLDGKWHNQAIPESAILEFLELIQKTTTQGDSQDILEHFKGYFCRALGTIHVWSSSPSWTETDLSNFMSEAAENAPLFLEAFYDACENLQKHNTNYYVPDVFMMNKVCVNHQIGYEIQLPNLVLRENQSELVEVPQQPSTLAEQARPLFQNSLQRAEDLLTEGRGREAVQETLWLLESVSTTFIGLEIGTNKIKAKYFSDIVKELRKFSKGTTLEIVLVWITNLHGYLSSPTGGGVRHGLDLNKGILISENEAKLFCNLVRSYLSFLLVEHKSLVQEKEQDKEVGF